MKNNAIWKYALAAGLVSGWGHLGAQDTDDLLVEEDVVMLEEVGADDVPIEENILATSRPISSVYGSDRSILDTPRNVNIVSREQLDAISIKDVRDFSKLTSSSYTKTNFGAPTTPNLRGQEADLFINGVRRGMSVNGNGVPINFNSVESVNIVKGPAGAVFGTSNYVGGYVDLVTKRANFQNSGKVSYSIASYDQHTFNLDVNIPVSETVAVRASVEAKEWDGFWDKYYQKSQSAYFTVAWKPNDKYRLDVMAEYYNGNYTENWGINRVTQDLIDNGRYLPNDQTDAQYFQHIAQLGNGQFSDAALGNLPPRTGDPTPASWAVNTGELAFLPFGPIAIAGLNTITPIDPNKTVPVDRSWKLSAPGDDSNADVFWAQAIQEFTVSDTLKITNNTYFHYKDRQTFSSYHYSELQRDNWSIDNRLQAIQEFEDVKGMEKITLNYGVRLKYQDIWAVNNFLNEPVNFFDLSRGDANNNFRVPDAAFAGQNYVSDEPSRGTLNQWYVGGDGDEDSGLDTQTTIIAPFIQADFELTEKLSFLTGVTIDYVDHDQQIPREIVDSTGARLSDYFKRDESAALYNANASVIFKPMPNISVYGTVNLGENYLAANGGAVDYESLIEPSTTELFEIGLNGSFLDDKVYVGTALFKQKYDERDQTGQVTTVDTLGLELEINYQPNRNFFATLGYSWLDSEKTFPAGSTPMASVYTASEAGQTNNYFISPSFISGGLASEQTFENAGVPEHLLNGLVQYKFDNGFGVQANIVVWGEMNSGYEGYEAVVRNPADASGASDFTVTADTARVDIQHEIDAKIFYEYENWRFEISAFNITDEENWDFNNSLYANGSAVARPDTNYQFLVSYEW
ncbi:MAG: TonB-dependent receptor plug domain-containing protein [Verrucomicrobia bacterium]|nr:TonB-dependent receptor plug domain-containing protein [Verrucomicrobiota bacterium]